MRRGCRSRTAAVADYPDGTNFEDVPDHPNTALFRDIPRSGQWITTRDLRTGARAKVWKATARGVITLPMTASRIAEHAELVGYVLNPELAKIKRIDPVRGGKSITSPGTWVDIDVPEPPPNPVHQVDAQAAELMPSELLELRDRIDARIEGMA